MSQNPCGFRARGSGEPRSSRGLGEYVPMAVFICEVRIHASNWWECVLGIGELAWKLVTVS